MAAKEEVVSEDQANEALQQFLVGEEVQESEEVSPEPEQEPESEEEPEPLAAAEPEAGEETEEPEGDDIESLKERAARFEAEAAESEKRYQEKLRAIQQRHRANEEILRTRYMRKATAADNARKVLLASRSEAGATETDVDRAIRELEATMNERSPSYAPPEPVAPTGEQEDRSLVVNDFLNEMGMTDEEAESFSTWLQTDGQRELSPSEHAVARQSLDGFLRIAHPRWKNGAAEKERKARTDDAVQAVKAVKRTQQAAARAASATTSAPKKTSTPKQKTLDVSKLEPKDVSRLLRQTVEQYR